MDKLVVKSNQYVVRQTNRPTETGQIWHEVMKLHVYIMYIYNNTKPKDKVVKSNQPTDRPTDQLTHRPTLDSEHDGWWF